jgi:hypothetical protein
MCCTNRHTFSNKSCRVCQRLETLPSSRSQDLFTALVKQMFAAGLPLQTIAVSTGRPSDMSLLAAARIARCATYVKHVCAYIYIYIYIYIYRILSCTLVARVNRVTSCIPLARIHTHVHRWPYTHSSSTQKYNCAFSHAHIRT